MKTKATAVKALGSLMIAGIISLTSCKEHGPDIILTDAVFKDTTYVGNVEAPQPRRILIEEATGVQCSNCPDGANKVKAIENQYPNRVIAVGVHGGSLTDPFRISRDTLRTKDADDLMNTYFAEAPPKPAACIDRVKYNGTYFIDRNDWAAKAAERLAGPQAANITISSQYDSLSNMAAVQVRVSFVQSVSKSLNLSLFLLEDHIIDPQEDGIVIDTNYEHNHVLRDIITPVSGFPLLSQFPTKEAGRVWIGTLRVPYALAAKLRARNCRLVAFVHANESGTREVIQVAEAEL